MSTYKEIAKRSFKAKWNIYLFKKVIYQNVKTINLNDFKAFKLKKDLIELYANEYWQELETHKIEDLEVSEIYNRIKKYEKENPNVVQVFKADYVENDFLMLFEKSAFDTMKESHHCHYCKITKDEIEALGAHRKLRKKNLRGWNLEIDRKKPNLEYSANNCVMSCYWCNNAKTDEFSDTEFKPIAEEIGRVLKERLKEITVNL